MLTYSCRNMSLPMTWCPLWGRWSLWDRHWRAMRSASEFYLQFLLVTLKPISEFCSTKIHSWYKWIFISGLNIASWEEMHLKVKKFLLSISNIPCCLNLFPVYVGLSIYSCCTNHHPSPLSYQQRLISPTSILYVYQINGDIFIRTII